MNAHINCLSNCVYRTQKSNAHYWSSVYIRKENNNQSAVRRPNIHRVQQHRAATTTASGNRFHTEHARTCSHGLCSRGNSYSSRLLQFISRSGTSIIIIVINAIIISSRFHSHIWNQHHQRPRPSHPPSYTPCDTGTDAWRTKHEKISCQSFA